MLDASIPTSAKAVIMAFFSSFFKRDPAMVYMFVPVLGELGKKKKKRRNILIPVLNVKEVSLPI